MLAIAVGRGPVVNGAAIDYLEAPADRLPVPDGSFDVATCQQGLQFFPDRLAALDEIHRALRAGGRIGIAVGKRIAECPPFEVLAEAIRALAATSSPTATRVDRGACRWPAICARCWTVPGSRT